MTPINAVQNINPFAASGSAHAISRVQSGGNPFAESSSGSGSNTVGLSGLQTGDSVYTTAQAGKQGGISRVLGYA